MFTIRKEQVEVFEEAAYPNFESAMLEHLKVRQPDVSRELNETQLRAVIRCGFVRARAHGITLYEDIADFTCLIFVFGPYFDELPWARRALEDPDHPDPEERASQLYLNGLEACAAVVAQEKGKGMA